MPVSFSRAALCASALILFGVFAGACQKYYVQVNNFQVARFRPSLIPINSALDIVYDMIVDSDQTVGRDRPLPITSFDTHFFLEGEKAVASKMPPGVKSITLGQPVRMQGQIVLKDVAELAPRLPLLLRKDEWEIGVRGSMGLKTLGLDIVKVPLLYQKNIPNPTKDEGFRRQLPPELNGILKNI